MRTIVLDSKHTEQLIKFASRNELNTNSDNKFEFNSSLVSMILFDDIKILPLSGKNGGGMQQLYREGLVSDINIGTFDKAISNVDQYKNDLYMGLMDSDSISGSELLTNQRLIEKSMESYFPFVTCSNTNDLNVSWEEARRILTDVIITMPVVDQGLIIEEEGHSSWFNNTFTKMDDELFHMVAADSKVSVQKLKKNYQQYNVILRKTIEYWGLIDLAKETGASLKASCSLTPSSVDQSFGEEAYQLCKIHFEEVGIMPVITCVDDMLRLREHKYLKDFREAIYERLDRIADGDMTQDQKYRQYVRTANNQLKKLGKWQYLNSPYVVLASLLVSTIPPLMAIGAGLTALTGVATLDAISKERKYGFAAFPK